MTPPCRPRVDADSLYALHEAIEILALLRGIYCPIADPDQNPDPAHALQLAWSLSLQIDAYLPELIEQARNHGYTWHQIDDCFNPPATR